VVRHQALREAFDRDGVVRVAGAIAPPDVAAMRDCVRERIAPLELVEIAGALRPARGIELDLWAIGREPALAPLPGALAGAVDRVFGPGVWAQVEGELGGLAMPNLPCRGAPWSVCEAAWHVDEPTPAGHEPGRVLLAFAYLDLVEPGGGATVALAGSPRRLAILAEQLAAPATTDAALAALAREEPWLADLIRLELTGDPGDIVLMDPRCLHTTSANVSSRPRLTMRMTCMRR
jgi:hypothetical protein